MIGNSNYLEILATGTIFHNYDPIMLGYYMLQPTRNTQHDTLMFTCICRKTLMDINIYTSQDISSQASCQKFRKHVDKMNKILV